MLAAKKVDVSAAGFYSSVERTAAVDFSVGSIKLSTKLQARRPTRPAVQLFVYLNVMAKFAWVVFIISVLAAAVVFVTIRMAGEVGNGNEAFCEKVASFQVFCSELISTLDTYFLK